MFVPILDSFLLYCLVLFNSVKLSISQKSYIFKRLQALQGNLHRQKVVLFLVLLHKYGKDYESSLIHELLIQIIDFFSLWPEVAACWFEKKDCRGIYFELNFLNIFLFMSD